MRSRPQYSVTKDEVHGYANPWLSSALRLEYEGTKCTARTLLQVLHKGPRYTLALTRVEVVRYLKRAGVGFLTPALVRGRKSKGRKKAAGLRALRQKNSGYDRHTRTGKIQDKPRSTRVTTCVARKSYTHPKAGKRRSKQLLYVVYKVRLTPQAIREMYRTRFGIETSYRPRNEARIKTCTRDPRLRLLFVGIALVLRNVWVGLHFKLAQRK